jgi:hypothetical protein
LVQIDENQNKRDRVEFLQAMGGFLSQALPMGQQAPELVPMLVDMVKFGMSAYKQATSIEGTIDQAMEQMKQKQMQASQQPPQPDPETVKLQMQQQADQMRAQTDMQIEQFKAQNTAQLEQQKQQYEIAIKQQELEMKERYERWKSELEASTKIMVARIGANPGLDLPLLEAQEAASRHIVAELGDNVAQAINRMAEMQNQMANMQGETSNRLNGVMQMLAAPKRIIRGADGKAAGVEVVQ